VTATKETKDTVMVIKMGMVLAWLVAVVVCAATDQHVVFVAVFACLLTWSAFSFGMDLKDWDSQR
jgi:hypothetical protein